MDQAGSVLGTNAHAGDHVDPDDKATQAEVTCAKPGGVTRNITLLGARPGRSDSASLRSRRSWGSGGGRSRGHGDCGAVTGGQRRQWYVRRRGRAEGPGGWLGGRRGVRNIVLALSPQAVAHPAESLAGAAIAIETTAVAPFTGARDDRMMEFGATPAVGRFLLDPCEDISISRLHLSQELCRRAEQRPHVEKLECVLTSVDAVVCLGLDVAAIHADARVQEEEKVEGHLITF